MRIVGCNVDDDDDDDVYDVDDTEETCICLIIKILTF